jgi:WASH complex subunit strumpellin
MRRTLVGVIHVDPHRLLEEGVRKALVGHIAAVLHDALQFPKKDRMPFARRLTDLGQKLNGMRSSFKQGDAALLRSFLPPSS